MTPKEYMEEELSEIDTLIERMETLNKRWFKTSYIHKEIDFLKEYIQAKRKFFEEFFKDIPII